MDELFTYFLNKESVFGLMFIALFIFHIRTARDRERDNRAQVELKIDELKTDVKLLVMLWKTLLEEEVKKRKEE